MPLARRILSASIHWSIGAAAFQYSALIALRRASICRPFCLRESVPANACDAVAVNGKCSSDGQLLSRTSFMDQVTSFLDIQDIPYRHVETSEVYSILNSFVHQKNATHSTATLKSMLNKRTILLVGKDYQNDLTGNANFRHTFVLHICPTLHLSDIQDLHKHYNPNEESSPSEAVVSYAWLNAYLTNAFSEHTNSDKSTVPLVHLHQDVWNRSPQIVQSRLRSKVGIHNQRIYARKTTARRIPKSIYLPFLETNHLWGATGAKFGYGLYIQSKLLHTEEEILVAVATFSSKRKISRGGNEYHSHELLRFCTELDTTIVGGLTKLISAFVKDVPEKQPSDVGIDIVTSIDRDFGSNTWPKFHTIDVMDPVPMFVGEDGIRRHAVGAGIFPLDLGEVDGKNDVRASDLLRAGLPLRLIGEMNSCINDTHCDPWEAAANDGFHPVFDAGVERLLHIVRRPIGAHRHENIHELWEQSVPRFVTEHYSPNEVVEQMLQCVRKSKVF